jgi:bacillopeptidase F (M6 metalloprotease family)
VIQVKRADRANQRWKVVYLDKAKKEPTSGLNEEFGFYINRPFYLISRLPMRRVAQCHGANNIALNRWLKNRKDQMFVFDGVSKTIRSHNWKNNAMEIQSNGNSANLRMTSGINSRWW